MSFTTQFLHFDSANSNYIFDSANTSSSNLNPYKSQYAMNQSFRNIKRVNLVSVELPVGFTNIRTGSTDKFIFVLNNITYTITLPEKIYSSVSQIIADLNTLIAIKLNGVSITMILSFSISQFTPNRILITFTGTSNGFAISFSDTTNTLSQGLGITPLATISTPKNSTFSIIDTNLSKFILGFRAAKDNFVTYNVFAALTSNYNLNCDNYINMYIPSLNGMNACMGNQQSTFKIPLNSVSNQVYYYFEGNTYKQFVDITDKSLCLNGLIVILTDKFGNNINPNGLDFSFTLSIELYN